MSHRPRPKFLQEVLKKKGFFDASPEERLRQCEALIVKVKGTAPGDKEVGINELRRLRGTDHEQ